MIFLFTASLLQICAAFTCKIDTSLYQSCKDQKRCKFVPASPATPAVLRDEFICVPSEAISCVHGKTKSYSSNQTLIAVCRKGGVVFSELDCSKRNGLCVASKFKSKSHSRPYKPAECVPKICADYNGATCETNSSCLFRPKTTGIGGKYRCACPLCDTSEQKRACERASPDYCGAPDLGGPGCCETHVVIPPIPPVPAECYERKSAEEPVYHNSTSYMPIVIVVLAGLACVLGPIVLFILYRYVNIRGRDNLERQRNENLHLNTTADTLQQPLELVPTAYPIAVATHVTDTNEKSKLPEASAEPITTATAVQL